MVAQSGIHLGPTRMRAALQVQDKKQVSFTFLLNFEFSLNF